MRLNGYTNTSCPNTVYCYKHGSVASYGEAKSFFAHLDTPISFDKGIIFSLEPLDKVSDDFPYNETIPYSSVPPHVQRDLIKQAIKNKLLSFGLTEKPGCLFFPKNHTSFPPKNIPAENLFINFGVSTHIFAVQGKDLFLIDPKMIVTKDGETWDYDFAEANYGTLNKNSMQYAQFISIIDTIERILGDKFTIDFKAGNYEFELITPIDHQELKVTGPEPKISFGTGMSDDFPARGLKRYGPRDYNLSVPERPRDIKIGIISKREDFPLLSRVRSGEKGKKYPFPGFKSAYKTDLVGKNSWVAKITESELMDCTTEDELTTLFEGKLQQIKETCDVYVIELPLATQIQIAGVDLRDFLKILFWKERKASQVVLHITEDKYTDLVVDNLALGIYVSAGGHPWILEEPCEDQVFIGISFGKSKDNRTLIGTVEVFDSYGVSLGIEVSEVKKFDRDIRENDYHLSKPVLEELVKNSVKRYVFEYKHDPAKLTIHKTSPFNEEELSALDAVKDLSPEINFLYISSKGKHLYLLPEDNSAPKRLRYWIPETNKAFLYTKGDSEWGKSFDPFIPKPMYVELQAKSANSDYTIDQACMDIIKLTKLNWNSVATYEREPVTISHSRKIADLLRNGLSLGDSPRDVKYFI